MALKGLQDEQIKEAGWAVRSVVGASAYLHSIDYNVDQFKQEVNQTVDFIRKKAKKAA